MPNIMIQGHQFAVPDAVVAYQIGHTLTEEGEVNALRQVKLENLRNNFAPKVKKELGEAETLTDEQVAKLQAEFETYAGAYKFGVRAEGTGAPRMDPLTREMHNLAKADFVRAYSAKFDQKPDKELIAERVPELVEKRADDYRKRANAILRQRQSAAADTLEAVGL